MGKINTIAQVKLNDKHIKKLKKFIEKIIKLNHIERISYFQTIEPKEINLISEIILNFLNLNIKLDSRSYNLLKRVRDKLYLLTKKKTSVKIKRLILKSIKGLGIIKILFPLALKVISAV